MQASAILLLALVAYASAAPSSQVSPSSSSVTSQDQSTSGSSVSGSAPVLGNAPVVVPVAGQNSNLEVPPPPVDQPVHPVPVAPPVAPAPGASYYSPAGVVTVVGSEQQQAGVAGPKSVVGAHGEQYGQPEPASLPPNYKPWGSWGLYIGGNPADGYYTNYYKALSSSVDKQQHQAGDQVKPQVGQVSALSPVLKQAGSSPFAGGDYYPFAYSPSDFNAAAPHPQAPQQVHPVHHVPVSSGPVSSPVVSPVQAGAQVYGAPTSFESNSPSSYADFYATKRIGGLKESAKQQQQQQQQVEVGPSKGYQQRVYVYPPAVSASPVAPLAGPASPAAVPQSSQVLAYPVPVGSQMVGSQPGVEGAFNPYGIHAFTRYAIKPTVVKQDSSYYYSYQAPGQVSSAVGYYKQQPQSHQHQSYHNQQAYGSPAAPVQQVGPVASPHSYSYYGYPVGQLHYSPGSLAPVQHQNEHYFSPQPVDGVQPDGVVYKQDQDDKVSSVVGKPQKRA